MECSGTGGTVRLDWGRWTMRALSGSARGPRRSSRRGEPAADPGSPHRTPAEVRQARAPDREMAGPRRLRHAPRSVRSGMPADLAGPRPASTPPSRETHGSPEPTLTGPPAEAPGRPTGRRAARRPRRPRCRPGGPPAARSRTRARGRHASQGRIPAGRRPVQVQRQPHPRERVRHVQARQVIRHPHPPASRGRRPGEHHPWSRTPAHTRPPQAAGRKLPPWATSGHSHTPTAWYATCQPAGQARPGSSQHWPGHPQAVRQVPSLTPQRIRSDTMLPENASERGYVPRPAHSNMSEGN